MTRLAQPLIALAFAVAACTVALAWPVEKKPVQIVSLGKAPNAPAVSVREPRSTEVRDTLATLLAPARSVPEARFVARHAGVTLRARSASADRRQEAPRVARRLSQSGEGGQGRPGGVASPAQAAADIAAWGESFALLTAAAHVPQALRDLAAE